MNHKQNLKIACTLILSGMLISYNLFAEPTTEKKDYPVSVKVFGNSWLANDPMSSDEIITENGIQNWSNPESCIRTYFRIEKPGTIQLAITAHVSGGKSVLKVSFGGQSKEIVLKNSEPEIIDLGAFAVERAGYHFLEIKGVSKTSGEFARITDVLIGGEVAAGKTWFVKDDLYWGRRGPSVHLNYEIPADAGNIRWFYNEMTIPEGNDVLGSYFMANGFAEGYFGIQVNSATERRILFSVWSPFKTDDPKSIPDDQKIKLLKKGDGVYAGEFGNEGSGGQSYRKYPWKAGVTYRFLLKGEPLENNSTDYSAYFYAPEIGKWELIASFRRPQTSTYLKRLHSFLENFIPEMGAVSRQVIYSNQWVCNTAGKWTELKRAKFTADATARKESRLDYAGGTSTHYFFLKNCGFFSERVPFDTYFERPSAGSQPEIELPE
ncbi:MAG: DUF3472 domain-containing protein [Prolixibacteraceae bacterium]|nr:DUF3472 domain-containing protein [Prolixibacteraceae bacterium]